MYGLIAVAALALITETLTAVVLARTIDDLALILAHF